MPPIEGVTGPRRTTRARYIVLQGLGRTCERKPAAVLSGHDSANSREVSAVVATVRTHQPATAPSVYFDFVKNFTKSRQAFGPALAW